MERALDGSASALTPSKSVSPSYFPALTGLRALAAVMVLIGHVWPAGVGHVGVGSTLAFALSGFLIAGRLIAEIERAGTIDVRHFLARRTLRLLPATLVMVVVVTAVMRPAWFDVLFVFTHLTNWARAFGHSMGPFGHLWSLSVEEQFYAVAPATLLLLARVARRHAGLSLRVCIAVASALGMAVGQGLRWLMWEDEPRWYNGTDTRLDSLLVGVFVAAVLPWLLRRVGPWGWGVGAAVSGVGLAAAYVLREEQWASTVAVPLLSGLHVVAVSQSSAGIVYRVLRSAVVQWVGTVSFGLYLWHFPLIRMLPDMPPRERIVVIPLLSMLCASLSWYGLEKPLSKRIGPRLRARTLSQSLTTQNDALPAGAKGER